MNRSRNTVLLLAAPVMALLCGVFRVAVLKTALDAQGLPAPGSKVLLLTVLVCALCFGGLWLLSFGLNRLPGTEACFSRRGLALFGGLAAGLLVLFGSAMTLLEGGETLDSFQRYTAMGGGLSGLLMLWTALDKRGGVFWARLELAIFTGATLILRFQTWSHDPLVLHILPAVLAQACVLVAVVLLPAFSLSVGHRRSTVLFGLATAVFTLMSLPDHFLGLSDGLPRLLVQLGLCLWVLTAALELLSDRVQSETAPEKAPETPEEKTSESPE